MSPRAHNTQLFKRLYTLSLRSYWQLTAAEVRIIIFFSSAVLVSCPCCREHPYPILMWATITKLSRSQKLKNKAAQRYWSLLSCLSSNPRDTHAKMCNMSLLHLQSASLVLNMLSDTNNRLVNTHKHVPCAKCNHQSSQTWGQYLP